MFRLPNIKETCGALIGFLGAAVMCLDAGSNGSEVSVEGDLVAFFGAAAMVIYLGTGSILRKWM